MRISTRSFTKELLDGNDISFVDIRQNMKELDFINTWLGGHAITIKALKKLLDGKRKISICEIGCGGGDNLLAIEKWCVKKGITVSLIGIDMKPECIAFAEGRTEFTSQVKWIVKDYQNVLFPSKPDIIFSSLFCHHFTDDELIFQFGWLRENATVGFFINDLHRHFLAYHAIKLLTKIFSKSYLVKNDAPLSVLRGFKKRELELLLSKAAIGKFTVGWRWAFRFVVIFKKVNR